jgi:hypothetical protein
MLPLAGGFQAAAKIGKHFVGIGSLIVIYREAANDLITNSSLDMRFGYWI